MENPADILKDLSEEDQFGILPYESYEEAQEDMKDSPSYQVFVKAWKTIHENWVATLRLELKCGKSLANKEHKSKQIEIIDQALKKHFKVMD